MPQLSSCSEYFADMLESGLIADALEGENKLILLGDS